MKKLIHIVILVVSLVMMSACQNNGHIGWLFGVWRLEEYTLNGEVQNSYKIEKTTFSFQNNIIEIVGLNNEFAEEDASWGTWELQDDELILNFTHHDDEYPAGTYFYRAPTWLNMTSDEIMHMDITHSSKNITLTWQSPQGTCIYKLNKTF